MNDGRPFLLLRARPKPEARRRFRPWFLDTHLRDVRRIPGIAETRYGVLPGGTTLGIYSFESSDVVGPALSSPQAAYARGTWEQWAPHLEELSIEIFAPLFPLPIYQSDS
jgi:hypothetical protein